LNGAKERSPKTPNLVFKGIKGEATGAERVSLL